jgi:hypothetical protein
VDAPSGLDEGDAAIQFSGAEARLLGPFWVQVMAGAVIALGGVMLAAAMRPARAPRRRAAGADGRARRSGGPSIGSTGVQGAGS